MTVLVKIIIFTLIAVIIGGTWTLIANSADPFTPISAVTSRSAPVITLPAPPKPLAVPRPVTCTVQAGDTLWSIAGRMYGDPAGWRRLYTLNQKTIRNPNLIYPGETLVVS
jgi:nucleoid-associated protein YgaU